MEIRRNPKNGDGVSLLGFGCMRLPTAAGGIDKAATERMVDFAIASGVNYFDTAYPYHNGMSEAVMGELLSKHPRDSFFLADKMPPWHVEKKGDMTRIFDEQLKKCRVDYFDYYLIHNMDETLVKTAEKFGFYEFLQEKKREGKLRNLGFSSHGSPDFLEGYMDKYAFDFAQLQINYLDWDGGQNARRQYEIASERGVPVVVMEPVRGGTLASLCERSSALLKGQSGSSVASWAIRFAAGLENVLTVLSGMSDMEQLKDNVKTLSPLSPLSKEEEKSVFLAAREFEMQNTVPCTACGYCMDCPSGVDIPGVFASYNEYKKTGSFSALPGEVGAENCTACGICTEHCPQNIEIPSLMGHIKGIQR